MHYKKALGYLLYAAILFGYLLYAQHLVLLLQRWNAENFRPLVLMVSFPAIYIILGVLLGLDQFVREALNRDGKWKADPLRLVFLGLPALYLSCIFLMFFYIHGVPGQLVMLLSSGPGIYIAGIIFGYVLITSFRRQGQSL